VPGHRHGPPQQLAAHALLEERELVAHVGGLGEAEPQQPLDREGVGRPAEDAHVLLAAGGAGGAVRARRGPDAHRREGAGVGEPERRPAPVELGTVGPRGVAGVRAVEVQQVLALHVEHQHPHAAAHLLVLQHEAHQRQGGAGLGGDAADARDRDVAALRAVEEVEVEVDRLAVAADPHRQPPGHRVLVEGHRPLHPPRAAHGPAGVGGDPALGVDAHDLHLGRADELAGHLAGRDDAGVGGQRGALQGGVALGDDAEGRDVAAGVLGGDGHEVVDLQALPVGQPHGEGLARRRLVPQDDPGGRLGARHAATASGASTSTLPP
jgi:hypothetical protein